MEDEIKLVAIPEGVLDLLIHLKQAYHFADIKAQVSPYHMSHYSSIESLIQLNT